MEFTSQVGQDRWVCETLRYKRNGFFLDIGANDGIWLSNTYYLEKELGWKGICVEPGITPFTSLVTNRSCICLRKFVCGYDGSADFYEINYSSRPRHPELQIVDASRLDTIMEAYDIPDVIDYVSLDVDGPDFEALKTFPFLKHRVLLWTLEHNNNQELKAKMKALMEENGYVIAVDNVCDQGYIFEDWWINAKYSR